MIEYRAGPLRIREVWFDEPHDLSGVDVVKFVQTRRPPMGASCRLCVSLELDLARSADDLFANAHKDTRYRIRRALERDGLAYEVVDPSAPGAVEEFCSFYDRWAKLKSSGGRLAAAREGLGSMDDVALRRYLDAGVLDLSRMVDEDGEALSWHTHVLTDRTARHHFVAERRDEFGDSRAAQLVGRANRGHFWRDILRFKEAGCTRYDFAGWYHPFADEQRMRVANFKAEFGGRVVREANCYLGVTPLGKLFVTSRHLAKKAAGRDVWRQRYELRV